MKIIYKKKHEINCNQQSQFEKKLIGLNVSLIGISLNGQPLHKIFNSEK